MDPRQIPSIPAAVYGNALPQGYQNVYVFNQYMPPFPSLYPMPTNPASAYFPPMSFGSMFPTATPQWGSPFNSQSTQDPEAAIAAIQAQAIQAIEAIRRTSANTPFSVPVSASVQKPQESKSTTATISPSKWLKSLEKALNKNSDDVMSIWENGSDYYSYLQCQKITVNGKNYQLPLDEVAYYFSLTLLCRSKTIAHFIFSRNENTLIPFIAKLELPKQASILENVLKTGLSSHYTEGDLFISSYLKHMNISTMEACLEKIKQSPESELKELAKKILENEMVSRKPVQEIILESDEEPEIKSSEPAPPKQAMQKKPAKNKNKDQWFYANNPNESVPKDQLAGKFKEGSNSYVLKYGVKSEVITFRTRQQRQDNSVWVFANDGKSKPENVPVSDYPSIIKRCKRSGMLGNRIVLTLHCYNRFKYKKKLPLKQLFVYKNSDSSNKISEIRRKIEESAQEKKNKTAPSVIDLTLENTPTISAESRMASNTQPTEVLLPNPPENKNEAMVQLSDLGDWDFDSSSRWSLYTHDSENVDSELPEGPNSESNPFELSTEPQSEQPSLPVVAASAPLIPASSNTPFNFFKPAETVKPTEELKLDLDSIDPPGILPLTHQLSLSVPSEFSFLNSPSRTLSEEIPGLTGAGMFSPPPELPNYFQTKRDLPDDLLDFEPLTKYQKK